MYYKWYYFDKEDFKKVIQKKIFDDNDNIAIVIHKNDDIDDSYKLNLVNKDLLPKYLPSLNCPNKWILKTSSQKNFEKFQLNEWKKQLYEWAIVITKLNSTFSVQLVKSQTIWRSSEYPIKVDTKNKCNINNCWCKPTNLIYSKFKISTLKNDIEVFNSSKTIKLVQFYRCLPITFNKKELDDILFPVLINNKELAIGLIKIKFQDSEEKGIQLLIKTRSIVFFRKNSSFPIKFDSSWIEINGIVKATTEFDKTEYAVIKWLNFNSQWLTVQYDETSNLHKHFKFYDFKRICYKEDSVFVLVKINEIIRLKWHFPYSLGILSKSISQYKIKVTQDWDKYEMHDLVQNIK